MAPTTYILDRPADDENVVPTVTYVLRHADGEITLKYLSGDTRDHDAQRDAWESFGITILLVVEGEQDLSNGDASAWVRF